MNTIIIICVTLVLCILILCIYKDRYDKRVVEQNCDVNMLIDDMITVKDLIERTLSNDIYDSCLKNNLLTMKTILSKYNDTLGNE